jgi:NADPH:quinone reductase-like Zn-dependent oxidoreductase
VRVVSPALVRPVCPASRRADGEQLSQITSLIEAGIVRRVLDRGFPFEATKVALAYIETGRSKGKVIVKLK